MLQIGMCRFFIPFCFWFFAYATAHAQGSTGVHGLIIQLKPGAQSEFRRELPSAAHAKRESLAQERMALVAQGSGVKAFAHRHLSGDHRLLRFAKPLQGVDLQDTMRRLRLHPDVAFVEPDVRLPLAQIPNDAEFLKQWHLGSRTLAASALEMSASWAITTGTSAITVAVLDTGVLRSHPDLAALGARLLPGYDFVDEVEFANDGDGRDGDASDPGDFVTAVEANSSLFSQLGCRVSNNSWHGTFIAGQIAAAANNGVGVAGMNWNANLLPVRVSSKCGAQLSDILDGMRWAAGLAVEGVPTNPHPAKVINLSFGGDQACTTSYQSVIDELASVGTLVVVAAGNGSGTQPRQLKRPADCRGVLTVGAVQSDGAKTAYSFVGSNVALMAPGGHGSGNATTTLILSTDNAGATTVGASTYGYKQGTSFSAPLATGVASLMLAINPRLSPDALIARMKTAALPHPALSSYASCLVNDTVACQCSTSQCGSGLLNPLGSLQSAFQPAAVIAALGVTTPGATVVLDGRSSAAVGTPTIASYAWSQVAGVSVSVPDVRSSVTQVVLPDSVGVVVFELLVTDTLGRSGQAQVYINLEKPVAVDQVTGSNGSGGGGADRWLAMVSMALICVAFVMRTRKKRKTNCGSAGSRT